MPVPSLVPCRRRFVMKKAHLSDADYRMWEAPSGRLVAVSHHVGCACGRACWFVSAGRVATTGRHWANQAWLNKLRVRLVASTMSGRSTWKGVERSQVPRPHVW